MVEPLLAYFAEAHLVIETDLTAEEKAVVAEGRRLRAESPDEYISLDHYLAYGTGG